MAAPKKKTAAAALAEAEQAEGTYARIQREAAEMRKKAGSSSQDLEPYVIDDVEPPIIIHPPSVDGQLTIAENVGPKGEIRVSSIRTVLRALTGENFDRVYELVKDGDEFDLVALINDIRGHFKPGSGSDDVPGKSRR
ncbi:tail assembly chaperone [Gordonia phage VanLee]|uniref:Tail assembly chaperone n=1 Tax=Gordonia phage VanLee TaxID=2845816 RepID=A0A8F2DA44_9CAUD|nr:tail assembly chaperone [Gordonia phage VanLee]QWS68134.1 tail assembly chaperone [Gordonia phage VanLee]